MIEAIWFFSLVDFTESQRVISAEEEHYITPYTPHSFGQGLDNSEKYFSAYSVPHNGIWSYSKWYPWMDRKLIRTALIFPGTYTESIVHFYFSMHLSLGNWRYLEWHTGAKFSRKSQGVRLSLGQETKEITLKVGEHGFNLQ